MAQTPIKQARWELWFFAVATVVVTAFVIYLVWVKLPVNFGNDLSTYGFLFTLVAFGLINLVGGWQFLLSLFEARDASVGNDVVKLSYLHLGERQVELSPMRITRTKVNKRRLTRDPKGFEPMWLLRFSGWHFAVVPIDWENPLETKTAPSDQ